MAAVHVGVLKLYTMKAVRMVGHEIERCSAVALATTEEEAITLVTDACASEMGDGRDGYKWKVESVTELNAAKGIMVSYESY